MSKPKNMTCTAAQNACTCVSIKTIQYTGKIDVCQTTPSVALENSFLLLLENKKNYWYPKFIKANQNNKNTD